VKLLVNANAENLSASYRTAVRIVSGLSSCGGGLFTGAPGPRNQGFSQVSGFIIVTRDADFYELGCIGAASDSDMAAMGHPTRDAEFCTSARGHTDHEIRRRFDPWFIGAGPLVNSVLGSARSQADLPVLISRNAVSR
jgi:hypothetical protein